MTHLTLTGVARTQRSRAQSHTSPFVSIKSLRVIFTLSWNDASLKFILFFNYCLADIEMSAVSFVVLHVKPAKKLDLFGAFYFYLRFDRV